MNLHIVTDSSISETFRKNLESLNLLGNNLIVARCNHKELKYLAKGVPFASVYSKHFRSIIGDTTRFTKVFIHQFSPLMYRWIASHEFNELNWMVWGADLYRLPGIQFNFHEPLTRAKYEQTHFDRARFLFELKVFVTNSIFEAKAYSKINNVLTWMINEYDFARKHLPSLRARHQFFFYENDLPYHQLDELAKDYRSNSEGKVQRLIIGNSGTSSNNHLDTILRLEESKIKADLLIPVSYGDKKYIRFLENNLPVYSGGKIEFISNFMAFEEYIKFCLSADGLIVNTIRPQGYGNILMMLYLGKKVLLNEKNISLPDLQSYGIYITPWKELTVPTNETRTRTNKNAIMNLFSHDKLENLYRELF